MVPKALVRMASKDRYLSDHVGGSEKVRHPIKNEQGKVVGFFTPRISDDGTLRIGATWVHPDHRGKGLASKALRELVEGKAARAYIDTDNKESRRLFQAAGFKQREAEERWGGGHWFRTPLEIEAKRKRDQAASKEKTSMDYSTFKSFVEKIAFVAKTPKMKLELHHQADKKDWGKFEKNLKAKGFQQAALGHPESDKKLKKYVKNFGGYLNSKEVVGVVPSRSSSKMYKVKQLETGRLGCNCKDWQYKHSVKGTDCDHIKELKQGLVKVSYALATLARGAASARKLSRMGDVASKSKMEGALSRENERRLYTGEPLFAGEH